MEIDYINGKKRAYIVGVYRYQKEIQERLKDVKRNVIEFTSLVDILKRVQKTIAPMRAHDNLLAISSSSTRMVSFPTNKLFNTFLNMGANGCDYINKCQYLYLVKKKVKKGNIKHITSQELAYLLKLIKIEKAIVTCYDLIPWAHEKNRSFIWRLHIAGLKKADRIITISEFSKNEIIKYLGYPEDKIHVIYPAVDHDNYYEKRDRAILKKYNIPGNEKIILYVGSEQPRQNLPFLIRAFGKLKKMLPEAKLLKIGSSQWLGAREENLKLIRELNLQDDVIFVGYVAEEELPKWYNAADLFVYPCLAAGFGLPPLEATACGCPVIASNVASLPEVIGNAGIIVDPYAINGLADAMYEVLTNDGLKEDMIKKGLERAKRFSWENAAEETLKVYEEVYNER